MPPKRAKPSPLQPPVRFTVRSPITQAAPLPQRPNPPTPPGPSPSSQPVTPSMDLGVNPDSEAPLTVKAMYQMLAALRSDISGELKSSLQEIRSNITDIGDRTDHLETKMAELVQSHNGLIDAHGTLQKEVDTLRHKIVDLEDRARRNNIKVRGIPETVLNQDLGEYVLTIFHKLLPDANDKDLLIDRIHRLPKSNFAPPNQPRDTLLRIHFFHIKENILRAARNLERPAVLGDIQLFPDLSASTLAGRREFRPITAALRSKGITYRWGFPIKLLVRHSGSTHAITSMEAGLSLLSSWDIPVQAPSISHSPPIQAEWSRVGET